MKLVSANEHYNTTSNSPKTLYRKRRMWFAKKTSRKEMLSNSLAWNRWGEFRPTKLADIDENLVRNELDAISIGELAIRRDEILEALGLRATSGTNIKNSRTGETISPVPKRRLVTTSIAKQVGRNPHYQQSSCRW